MWWWAKAAMNVVVGQGWHECGGGPTQNSDRTSPLMDAMIFAVA